MFKVTRSHENQTIGVWPRTDEMTYNTTLFKAFLAFSIIYSSAQDAVISSGQQNIYRNKFPEKESPSESAVLMEEMRADVIFDRDMKGIPLRPIKTDGARLKRTITNFKRRPTLKWDNPIHYHLDKKLSQDDKDSVQQAIKYWQPLTCLEFTEIPPNEDFRKRYINFENDGCWSYIGRAEPQDLIQQPVKIGTCKHDKFGMSLRLIGYVVGLIQEAARPDNEKYIKVFEKNIATDDIGNFRASTYFDTDNLPYDFGSIMHHHRYAYSFSGLPAFESLNPLYRRTMGQQIEVSFLDAKAVNLKYCKASCENITLEKACERGGYQDPNNCQQCRCPDGFGGHYCERLQAPKSAKCGGRISLSAGEEKIIVSPEFGSLGYFENETQCNWLIEAAHNYTVRLTFEGGFGYNCSKTTVCIRWLEVRYEDDLGVTGPRFCCDENPGPIVSKNEEMLLIMRSNSYIKYNIFRIGFKARVKAVILDQPRCTSPQIPVIQSVNASYDEEGKTTNASITWKVLTSAGHNCVNYSKFELLYSNGVDSTKVISIPSFITNNTYAVHFLFPKKSEHSFVVRVFNNAGLSSTSKKYTVAKKYTAGYSIGSGTPSVSLIVGITVGAVILLLICVAVIYLVVHKVDKNQEQDKSNATDPYSRYEAPQNVYVPKDTSRYMGMNALHSYLKPDHIYDDITRGTLERKLSGINAEIPEGHFESKPEEGAEHKSSKSSQSDNRQTKEAADDHDYITILY